jgi:SAM-dependent MidA family methyltransferase
MNELAKILRAEMEPKGAIPFARFMELALYCPKFGYYERPEQAIGRQGDFYTSVSVGPIFGELLAFEFVQWARAVSGPICWVETGAHNGQLAFDILNWLSLNHADLLARFAYWVVEPSPTRQCWQRSKLEKFAGQVHWAESFSAFAEQSTAGAEAARLREATNGRRAASSPYQVIFSNELLDAFPVHRIGWDAGKRRWFEWGVGVEGEQFVWKRMPHSVSPALFQVIGLEWLEASYATVQPEASAYLPDGFTIEIAPTAIDWWRQAAGILRQGKLVTIDYGLTIDEMLTPQRANGTLRAYYRHHLAPDLLANPGDQDLTASVNFTALQRAGEAAGRRTEGLFSQAQFLTCLAQKMWKEKNASQWDARQLRQFQTLIHPQWLGRAFRVLVQSR